MKKIIAFIGFILLYQISSSQWKVMPGNYSTAGGNGGRDRTCFAIPSLGKGYFIGGAPNVRTTFCYDTAAKSWTQVKDYPGQPDGEMVGLSVNDTGYLFTGAHGSWITDNSTWRYDPVSNTWIERANFPGDPRAYAVGFTIGRMCFVGCGVGSPLFTNLKDFYEYDPWKNTWTEIKPYPGAGSLLCVSFVIGDKAYVGCGITVNTSNGSSASVNEDFYEYDTTSKVWTQVADFGGGVRSGATGFGFCDKGYVGLGTSNTSQTDYHDDFWEFDPNKGLHGTWTQVANYGGTPRYVASSFVIGKTAFVGLGVGNTNATQYDLWEFTPGVTPGFTANNTICAGNSIAFTDTSNYTPTEWQWTFPGGTPATSTAQNPTITYSAAGNYDVTLKAWNGCDSGSKTFTNYVTVNAAPPVAITPVNPTTCSGSSITLTASGGTTYQWNGTANTTNTIQGNPTKDTTYVLSVSDGTCSKDTSISVTVTPLPVPTISTAQSLCMGGSVPLLAGGGSAYTWVPANGLSSTIIDNPVASPTNTITYTVTVANGSCTATDNVTVTVNPTPTLSVAGTATITIGQNTGLGVASGAGNTYTWSPAATLSCATCASSVATPTVTTWYTVTVTDNSNCSAEDSVLITVNQSCGAVYIPNAFSPNGDGTNDVLNVMGNCIKNLDLVIFDRWGNKVFETTNPESGWDGTWKGKPLNTGTYVFSVQITDLENNTINKKGNVTLLR